MILRSARHLILGGVRLAGLCPGRLTILTPSEPRFRGCQLSLRFDCLVDKVEGEMRMVQNHQLRTKI